MLSEPQSAHAPRQRMSEAELFAANLPTGDAGLAVDKVGGALLWFDPNTYEQIARLPLVHPHQMALSPDHSMLYVGEYGVIKGGRNIAPGHM